ncbi:hypothetical protein QUF56_12215 [Ureibacillus composti]|nr:hypothetical protein [Ureibacillus composti]
MDLAKLKNTAIKAITDNSKLQFRSKAPFEVYVKIGTDPSKSKPFYVEKISSMGTRFSKSEWLLF